MPKERNQFVDIMRGVAMLLVVLGHTMTGSTANSQSSFLFNIIWSLQMPLFILISGYVTRYSRAISKFGDLMKFLAKRTLAYLLPFAVWSFLIRGFILRQSVFFDIKYMLWHIDSGYWFLITIWTISVIFGISSLVSSLAKKEIVKQILTAAVYVCGMAVLALIGYFAGMTFLGIKLTLYYMPFYFAGYLYGQYRDKIFALKSGNTAVDIIVALSAALWIYLLTRANMFNLPDGGKYIIFRAGASLLGCIALCGVLKGVFAAADGKKRSRSPLVWAGKHSLEIYLSHYLFLCLIKTQSLPDFWTIKGVALVAANYVLTLVITVLVIKLTNVGKTLPLCLYGKKQKTTLIASE